MKYLKQQVLVKYQESGAKQTASREQKASPVHQQTCRKEEQKVKTGSFIQDGQTALARDGMSPERHNYGRGLGTRGDECNNEEEDEKRDECVAGPVALPRHGVPILVQVGFDDDQLELVDLTAGGRSDDLAALNAAAVCVVSDLWSENKEQTF